VPRDGSTAGSTRKGSAKPVSSEQRIRDLRKEFRTLDTEPPGPERAERLATFTRAAHDDRQLNMAMHAAALCLDDDPDAPTLLVSAYSEPDADPETQLATYDGLRDLARYVDRPDVAAIAEERLGAVARAWVATAEPSERRYRLRTIQSLTSRATADALRDEFDPPGGPR
jgi:hypothetical protein